MSVKEEALQDIVALVKHNSISLDEIRHALETPPRLASKPSSSVLSKLLGYIGGIFVFAGIGVFISMYWDDFGSAARVIVTLGAGLMAFIMGLVCLSDKRYDKAVTPLFIISSIMQPMGILVMLQEYSSGGDARHGLIFMSAYMLIQQGALFWAKRLSVLAFSAILFGCILIANLLDVWNWDGEMIGMIIGVSLICIAYALQKSKNLAIAPFWYFVGGIILMWSVFEVVKNTPLELLYLGLSALIIFISTCTQPCVVVCWHTSDAALYWLLHG